MINLIEKSKLNTTRPFKSGLSRYTDNGLIIYIISLDIGILT